MLSDRNYMREETPNAALKPLAWIIGALVAIHVVQHIVVRAGSDAINAWLGLSIAGLSQGKVWTLLTYGVLHDTSDLWHIVLNVLGLVFLGRSLLPAIGVKRFSATLLAGTLAGAILWSATHFAKGGALLGASAAIHALLALFCCMYANQRMTVLLAFIIPVTVVPKYLLMFIGGLTTLFFLFAELFPYGATSPIAHSAHLGGLIAGCIAFRYFRKVDEAPEEEKPAIELPRWLAKKKSTAAAVAEKYKVNLPPNRADLKAEVDRILDKINTSGFGSLTPEEKRTLDEARDLLSKR